LKSAGYGVMVRNGGSMGGETACDTLSQVYCHKQPRFEFIHRGQAFPVSTQKFKNSCSAKTTEPSEVHDCIMATLSHIMGYAATDRAMKRTITARASRRCIERQATSIDRIQVFCYC